MNEPRSEEYIYFDRIKTKLDPKFKNDIQSKIYIDSKYPPNYKINLRIIITEYLRMFSDNALKYYNQKGYTKYTKDDIKWIVTVPAIWNEYGKQFMRNCAKKAGMKKIIIALEPEAASLTMFKDDNVDEKYKEKGKIFMLIDAGGYTLDITINEIIDIQGNLKQLSPPSGGAYGSMNINDYLMKLIEETFTKKKIDDLRKNRYDLWKITLDSIEKKKKELRDDESDAPNYKIDIRFENNCEPGLFSWIFGKKCSK
jgi:molecular chaperone DnaK (HSP70)